MSDLNATDEAQLLGETHDLEWRGKTLKFSLVTQGVKAKFNAACKANALAEFEELKALFTTIDHQGKTVPDEQRINAEWIPIRDGLTSGQYKWGGPQANRFLSTLPGERIFLAALLAEGGTPLPDDEIVLFRREKREQWKSVFEVIMLESEAPKAKRPTTKTAGAGQ